MALNRRELFVSAAGLAAVSLGGRGMSQAAEDEPQTLRPAGRLLVIASANGLDACRRAVELLRRGEDPVDAVVAGVNLVEDDPNDNSVGYGGLPNEDGVVELDACVMHGPTHKGGAVAALRNIRNPSSVAKLVMRRTDRVLLVGDGALRFARAHGFKEENLLTEEARRQWLKWKETHSDVDDWLPPEGDDAQARHPVAQRPTGTVTCLALTADGDIGGCTSTSGLAYKLAGRVGDSPILGAGLYVDNAVGACGSTGRGEANLLNLSSFLVVEFMRGGATPEEACHRVLQRVAEHTEKRLRDRDGRPVYGLNLYALRKDGLFGGASLRGPGKMAVHEGTDARLVETPELFPAVPPP